MESKQFQERTFFLLSKWVNQRPGLEYANYGEPTAYRSEARSILQDKHDFERILGSCAWKTFTPEQIKDAFRAYSGRLELVLGDDGIPDHLEYCTGQYWPTEYRKAACAVLASLLWSYMRSCCDEPDASSLAKVSPGVYMRDTFKREFGARIGRKWFD